MNQHTPLSDASVVSPLPGAHPACFDAAPAHGAVASVAAPANTTTSGAFACITDSAHIDPQYQRAAQLLVRCALPHLHSIEADSAPQPNPPAHAGDLSTNGSEADVGSPDDSSSPLIEGAVRTSKTA